MNLRGETSKDVPDTILPEGHGTETIADSDSHCCVNSWASVEKSFAYLMFKLTTLDIFPSATR